MDEPVFETPQEPSSDLTRLNFNCPIALRDAFQAEASKQGRSMGSMLEQLMLEHLHRRISARSLLELGMLPDWIKRQPSAALEAGEDRPIPTLEIRPAEGKSLDDRVKLHEGVSSRLL
jgi:hypothetical protein